MYSRLSGIVLRDANLSQAYLEEVDLTGADLRNATLTGTSFREAVLNGADLTGATLGGTKFEGVQTNEQTRWPEGFTLPDA